MTLSPPTCDDALFFDAPHALPPLGELEGEEDLMPVLPPSPPSEKIPDVIERGSGGRTNAALVLSGGGANAAFQVGVLDALSADFRWTSVYGVSAGALNAALIGQGRLGTLRNVWLEESEDLVRRRRAWAFIYGLIFGRKGVYDNSAMRERIRELISEAPYVMPTFVGYVDLESTSYHLSNAASPRFPEKVIASSSIPLLFDQPRAEASARALTDGGLRNSTPLADAIDAGHQKIVVITNRRRDLEPAPSDELEGFVTLFGRTLEILLHEIAENDIRQCARINYLVKKAGGSVNGYRHVDLNVIRPTSDLGNMLDFGREHVTQAYEQGIGDGARFLRGA